MLQILLSDHIKLMDILEYFINIKTSGVNDMPIDGHRFQRVV